MNKQPINASTNKEYTGLNVCTLMNTPFADQTWATYKQWQELGFQVQKGEKGTKIQKIVVVMDKKTGDDKKVPKNYTVFNVAQVKNIEEQKESA